MRTTVNSHLVTLLAEVQIPRSLKRKPPPRSQRMQVNGTRRSPEWKVKNDPGLDPAAPVSKHRKPEPPSTEPPGLSFRHCSKTDPFLPLHYPTVAERPVHYELGRSIEREDNAPWLRSGRICAGQDDRERFANPCSARLLNHKSVKAALHDEES